MTRTPEAEGLDVVLVGSFNPAIFHPEWFLRHGIIAEQDAKEAKVQDVSDSVTLMQFCGMQLQCVGDQFSLATKNISMAERMQDMLLQMFSLLPHTPIVACGINPSVYYQVSGIEYWHKIGHTLAPKDLVWTGLLENPGLRSLTIKAPRRGDFPGEINVTVESSVKLPPGIHIKTNYHYGLPGETLHAGAAEHAMKLVRSEWKKAGGMARSVAEQIFDKIKPNDV